MMSGFVYLIRNQDIYKIGITQNLDQRMSQLKPDEIIAVQETQNFEQLEKDLHQRYSDVRIPQSEYFRLTEFQLENCIKTLQGEVDSQLFKENYTNFQLALLVPFIFVLLIIFFGLVFDLITDIDRFTVYKNSAKFTALIFSVLSPLVIISNIFKNISEFFSEENENETNKGLGILSWIVLFGLSFLTFSVLK